MRWKSIEHLSIREWLESLSGKQVYKVAWEPLINSKFSVYAEAVNAVWMWKKLVLRRGTRNDKGGFGRLAEAMAAPIRAGAKFLFTPAFPIIANIFQGHADAAWLAQLRRVRYLGNMCLVLRLKKSLSETYWLNVNDPGFPFVGVIEHTNFDSPDNYNGSRIAYLSRYLAVEDPHWAYTDAEYFEFALGHLKRMFPEMDASWVVEYAVWRSAYSQPVTERDYSQYVPAAATPFENALIATMAQIYPEDRGTNYAIRDGRKVAALLA